MPLVRSAEGKIRNRLYGTARWLRMRAVQLAREPLCAMCTKHGITKAATVCDHKDPHRGDLIKFWDPKNLQSLCGPCHSGVKLGDENRGYSNEIDPVTGIPRDSSHPFNK